MVLARKKDGSLRFCVDYRRLNAVTRKDAYALPRTDDTLDALSGSKWFSTLDLASGYWQVEVAPEDREKTAFCTQDGLFEFHNTGTQQGKDKNKINMDAISATECIRGRKERGVV